MLPPAPKFLPGLPPLMPPPAVRLQTQDAAAGPAPARVHEGAALSDDDEDDGLLPGQAAPGDGFIVVHDPSLTGMPLYCCCMALQGCRRRTRWRCGRRAAPSASASRFCRWRCGRRSALLVESGTPSRRPPRHYRRPRPSRVWSGGRAGSRAPCRARSALSSNPSTQKKGSWHRLRSAADACAANSRTMLDVMLCVDKGNVAARTNDFEAARGALGEELVNEKGLSTNKASLTPVPHGQVLRCGRLPSAGAPRCSERCDGPRPARVFSGAGPRDVLRTRRARQAALDRRSYNHRRPRITSHGAVARPGFRIAALSTFGAVVDGRPRSFSFAVHQTARPRADAAADAGRRI